MDELEVTGPRLADVLEGHFPLTSNRSMLEELTAARGRPVLAIVLAPQVILDRGAIDPLLSLLPTLADAADLDVFLDGQGPTTPEAFRVVSALRARFKHLTALVPFGASPGATMLALGADTLWMTDVASLSPLEPWGLSVELQRLRGELRALSAEDRATALSRVDLRDVGAVERAYASLSYLVRRIVESRTEPDGGHSATANADHAASVARMLCEGELLPSVPFMRRDCRDRLGLTVERPSNAMGDLAWRLHEYYRQMFGVEGDWVISDRHFSISYDGFLDTLNERRVLVRIHRLDERGRRVGDGPVLTRWVRPGDQEVVIDRELAL